MPMVKWFFGAPREIVEHRLHHRRRELLRREPVAPADDPRHLAAALVGHRLGEGGDHVLIERLAGRTGFLGAIEHRDRLDRGGNGVEQLLAENGRNRCTCTTPSFAPRAFR